MDIIPAIDIRGNNCVRLVQGKLDQETIYSKDPVFVAKLWQAKGAQRLHIVDLDGAFGGTLKHFDLIKKIRDSVHVTLEVGGGIRDIKTAERLFNAGIDKIIFGTVAVYNSDLVKATCEQFHGRVIVGIDGRQGHAAIGGWKEDTNVSVDELVDRMTALGITDFIYTDIARDGMLEGPNIDGINAFLSHKNVNVIASGGISSLNHIKALVELNNPRLVGLVIGKALYTEHIKVEDALRMVKEYAH